MTEFDLLQLIGEAKDEYVMDSRRRPKPKRSAPWMKLLAACLAVAVIGAAGAVMLRNGLFRNINAGQTLQAEAEAAAAEAPAEAPVPAPAEDFGNREEAAAAAEADEAPAEAVVESAANWLASAAYPDPVGVDDYEARSQVWTENQTSDETKSALNAFAYATASAVLSGSTESGAYSPLSLYQALALLTSGAEGQTRDQLLSLLGQSNLETLADQSGKLYRVNYVNNEAETMRISNSLWLDETDPDGAPVEYSRDWVMSAATDYYADVFSVEFGGEDAALALGEWISLRTGGMLHPSPESLGLDENTLMTIVNTLWFQSQWVDEFDQAKTAPGDFTPENGAAEKAQFMHATDWDGQYVRTDRYTKSYLPLRTGRMILVLPAEGVSLDSLLTEESLWEIFENGDYSSGEIHWSLPRFSHDASFDLEDTLQALGITDAFTGAADFSPISDTPLYVTQIQQGTHIAVDETGVEAAAYTSIAMAAGATLPEELPVVEMNLNRPFLYLITSNDGSALFLGVVRNVGE